MIPKQTRGSFLHDEAGATMTGLVQFLIVLGLLLGLILMGSQLKANANAVMTISRVKKYDDAVRNFQSSYGALPGDITNAKARLPNCNDLPCAAAGNGDTIVGDRKPLLNTPYYFSDTSENRTFWLHLAVAKLLNDVKSDGSRSQYFGQWGIEFPAAPVGVAGGFHIAYYSVTATSYNATSLLGHYMVLRGATDTYGIGTAPYSLTAKIAGIIDKKMDDGLPGTGRVVSIGSTSCSDAQGQYNTSAMDRGCNMLFQLSF